jgi:hypothetical protein
MPWIRKSSGPLDASRRRGVSVNADCTLAVTALDFSRVFGGASEQFASTDRSRWASRVRGAHDRLGNASKQYLSPGTGAPASIRDCSSGLSLAGGAGLLPGLQGSYLDRRCECLSRMDDLWLVCGDWLGRQWQSPDTCSHDCYTARSGPSRALRGSRLARRRVDAPACDAR